jgi:hypothetical protein
MSEVIAYYFAVTTGKGNKIFNQKLHVVTENNLDLIIYRGGRSVKDLETMQFLQVLCLCKKILMNMAYVRHICSVNDWVLLLKSNFCA